MNRVLYHSSYGCPGKFTVEQESFLVSRGLDPKTTEGAWENNRSHPVYLEMFDRFSEGGELVTEKGFYQSVLRVKEIQGDTYTILDYDGHETVMEPGDFEWRKI